MSAIGRAPGWLRRVASRTVDPWVARRATTLVHYRAVAQRPGDTPRDRLVDILRGTVLRDTSDVLGRDPQHPDLAAIDRIAATRLGQLAPNEVPAELVAPVSAAFTALWQPDDEPVDPPEPAVEAAITDQFHRLYYHVSARTWKGTTYRGVTTYKCPTDMWVYAELIDRLHPTLIIETGTFLGGSALYFADCLDRIGAGEVITVDIQDALPRPEHPRITYLAGSSTAPENVDAIKQRLPQSGHVLVILDSNHRQPHVAAELAAYAPMVTVGSYLIVEDTNINGHPAWPSWGPGPYEAAQEFLAGNDEFVVDSTYERYFLTQNPGGYLRRVR